MSPDGISITPQSRPKRCRRRAGLGQDEDEEGGRTGGGAGAGRGAHPALTPRGLGGTSSLFAVEISPRRSGGAAGAGTGTCPAVPPAPPRRSPGKERGGGTNGPVLYRFPTETQPVGRHPPGSSFRGALTPAALAPTRVPSPAVAYNAAPVIGSDCRSRPAAAAGKAAGSARIAAASGDALPGCRGA